MLVKNVMNYLAVYHHYITDNNLDNDINSLTIEDLITFVNEQIDEEDKERYGLVCTIQINENPIF